MLKNRENEPRVPYSPGENADDFVDETGDDGYPFDKELDFSDGYVLDEFDDEVQDLDDYESDEPFEDAV